MSAGRKPGSEIGQWGFEQGTATHWASVCGDAWWIGQIQVSREQKYISQLWWRATASSPSASGIDCEHALVLSPSHYLRTGMPNSVPFCKQVGLMLVGNLSRNRERFVFKWLLLKKGRNCTLQSSMCTEPSDNTNLGMCEWFRRLRVVGPKQHKSSQACALPSYR